MRTKIGDMIGNKHRTKSFSHRASKGKISIIKKTCYNCGHHKAQTNQYSGITKCTRCKKQHDKNNKR